MFFPPPQEFDLLDYSLLSARIFFRADLTAKEEQDSTTPPADEKPPEGSAPSGGGEAPPPPPDPAPSGGTYTAGMGQALQCLC